MAWIESHQELARHPKVVRLARTLDVSKPAAIGHLHMLWWWCLSYAQDGDLGQFTADEIAAGAEWDGEAPLFVEALMGSGWLDGDTHVHDWWEYAGKLIERRRSDAERKRAGRTQTIPKTSAGRPADDRKDGVRTQPNPTEQYPTEELALAKRNGKPAWDWLTDPDNPIHLPATNGNTRRIGKFNREISEQLTAEGVPEVDWGMVLSERARAWPLHFGDATLTPEALVKHLAALGRPPMRGDPKAMRRQAIRQKQLAEEGGGT